MPVLATSLKHFQEDIARAEKLNSYGTQCPTVDVGGDIHRGAWMMAVGAADAYFCDAYADLLARTLSANRLCPAMKLPDSIENLSVPAAAVFSASGGWRWRMVARRLIERESVLSLEQVKKLFNQFCRQQHKPFSDSNLGAWIVHTSSRRGLFGVGAADLRRAGKTKATVVGAARKKLDSRFQAIFQRRHDCIHNCDRPKVAIQTTGIDGMQVGKVVSDVEFLVLRFTETVAQEFPSWLRSCGVDAVTRNRVTQ